MRHQWRLLLQRCKLISELHFKVKSSSSPSLLHYRTLIPCSSAPHIHFQNPILPRPFSWSSSSGLLDLVEQNKCTDQPVITSLLIELYSDPVKSNEDVMLELKSKNDLNLNDSVIELFENRGSGPDAAKKFYDWVISKESDGLSSYSYNKMLGMLGENGLVKEFWGLVEIMKKQGYGVKKDVSIRAMTKFEEEGLGGDIQKLRDLFALGSIDTSELNIISRVCKVIRKGPWGDDVETKLQEMGVSYSSDLVKEVLQTLGAEPNKAGIFFRWIDESGLFKHDEKTYNAMVRELAREDYTDKLWRLVEEMRAAGFELEKGTYITVLNQFIRKKMVKDAVDLYEVAMGGNTKPPLQDCPFLLIKIVTSDVLDMNLFSKVLMIYKEGGNTLTNAILVAVLKSLASVGRYGEFNKILRAMEEVGFVPGEKFISNIALRAIKYSYPLRASKYSYSEETTEFLFFMEASVSLIEGYCISGHLDKACDCLKKLIKKEESCSAAHEMGILAYVYCTSAMKILTNAYCSKGRAADAYKLLSEIGFENEYCYTTYKLVISKLLDQGLFKEAINLLGKMKIHGYPLLSDPLIILDPFIKYVTNTGNTDDTIMLLIAMTVEFPPSTAVYTRIFEEYFKAKRHDQAHEFLSKCPRYIRNHPDVLNLFWL